MLTGMIGGLVSMRRARLRIRPPGLAELPDEGFPAPRWSVRVRGKRAASLMADPDFLGREPIGRGLFRIYMARKVRGAKGPI
jgi:hypothetical protein